MSVPLRAAPDGRRVHQNAITVQAVSPACPACTKPSGELSLVVEEFFRLARCHSCGTEFFSREKSDSAKVRDSAYWEDYKFEVYGDPSVRREFEGRYQRLVDLAEQRVGPITSLLDFGCGIGNFVSYASSRGVRAVGADVDARAVELGCSRGLDIITADEVDSRIPDSSLDAATMWDVIEHLLDPHQGLQDLVRKVRPGGALLFETPDAGFPVRRAILWLHARSGGRIDLTDPFYYLEHRTYFTEAGLRALLERSGCELVAVQRAQSPREKMAQLFAADAAKDSGVSRTLARVWPALETTARRAHIGNKLLAIARRN